MRNTTLKITLDKRRQKKDKTYPLVYRLTHFGKSTSIKSGYYVEEKHWDLSNNKIRNSCKLYHNVPSLNSHLLQNKLRYEELLISLEKSNQLNTFSVTRLKSHLVGVNSNTTFFKFTEKLIKELKSNNQFGSARSYKDTLRVIKNFNHDIDFKIRELTYDFLLKFENYYLSDSNRSPNGLAVYMRTIKAIFNKAKKRELIDSDLDPFRNYTIKTTKPKKRAINYSEIKKILDLEINSSEPLYDARNIFIMSYLMMGRPYVDLAYLKKEYINGDRIQYNRHKTGAEINVKITEPLNDILKIYLSQRTDSEFVLPIIKRESPEDQYNDMLSAQSSYNKQLKRLAAKAKVEGNLSSYVPRHSFATIALKLGVPIEAISEMLGHKDITTTQAYLAGHDPDTLDDFNDKIIKGG